MHMHMRCRVVRQRRRRRRRLAALVIQAHLRASICAKLEICSYGAIVCVIHGLRAMHCRAVCRSVYGRYPRLQPASVKLPGLPEAVRLRERRTRTMKLSSFKPFRWRGTTAAQLHGLLVMPATLSTRIAVTWPKVAPAGQVGRGLARRLSR